MLLTRLTALFALLFLALSLQSVSAMDHDACQHAGTSPSPQVVDAMMGHDSASCDSGCSHAVQTCHSCSHCIHAPGLPAGSLQAAVSLTMSLAGEAPYPLADLPPAALFKPPRDLFV